MIQEINISLLDAPVDLILHQANCHCVMGAGIAKQIRERFPEAYEADLKTKKGDIAKLGTFSIAIIKNPTTQIKYVANLYSQYHFGRDKRHTNYEALYNALESLKRKLIEKQKEGIKIGIPKNMGCFLAGGNWKIVKAIIEVIFEDSSFEIWICNYENKSNT